MAKNLREMIVAASQEPVPYEGLKVLSETKYQADLEPEPPTKADNPEHKEDFSRLLDAAVQKPQPDDGT